MKINNDKITENIFDNIPLHRKKNTMRSDEEERILFLLCHHYFLTISLIYNCFLVYFVANYT